MGEAKRIYIAIDLKSFYASVECVERGLDPLTTNLLVADASRTEKTICLAVSPSLKKYGIPGRARLFEVVQKCEEVKRRTGKEVPYIVATPRMQMYIDYSSRIYRTYLRYVSPEDIHIYSIDEICADIEYQYKNKIANCALFMLELVPEGNPPVDKAKILALKFLSFVK